jgi:hypothetical protein
LSDKPAITRDISDKPWHWTFAKDGIADVVQPGEVYEVDLRHDAPQHSSQAEELLWWR